MISAQKVLKFCSLILVVLLSSPLIADACDCEQGLGYELSIVNSSSQTVQVELITSCGTLGPYTVGPNSNQLIPVPQDCCIEELKDVYSGMTHNAGYMGCYSQDDISVQIGECDAQFFDDLVNCN